MEQINERFREFRERLKISNYYVLRLMLMKNGFAQE